MSSFNEFDFEPPKTFYWTINDSLIKKRMWPIFNRPIQKGDTAKVESDDFEQYEDEDDKWYVFTCQDIVISKTGNTYCIFDCGDISSFAVTDCMGVLLADQELSDYILTYAIETEEARGVFSNHEEEEE